MEEKQQKQPFWREESYDWSIFQSFSLVYLVFFVLEDGAYIIVFCLFLKLFMMEFITISEVISTSK